MKRLEVNDRVKVYGFLESETGTFQQSEADGTLMIVTQMDPFSRRVGLQCPGKGTMLWIAHENQCRKLKRKKKPSFWVSKEILTTPDPWTRISLWVFSSPPELEKEEYVELVVRKKPKC